MIKALIVDDEFLACDNLSKLIGLYCPDVTVAGTAHSVESAIVKINQVQPELVFLDVHLAQDTSFSILEQLSEISFSIIFISGHSNYAVNAFRVNAVDYLLKPIDSDDLVNAVEKYKTLQTLREKNNTQDVSIRVHKNDAVVFIPSSTIVSLTANDNYTTIFAKNNQKYTTAKTLKEVEEMLSHDTQFVRIHRSNVINLRFVENYSKAQPFTITMTDGSEHEISRRKRAEIIALLTKND